MDKVLVCTRARVLSFMSRREAFDDLEREGQPLSCTAS
jgi:hypothetical protein